MTSHEDGGAYLDSLIQEHTLLEEKIAQLRQERVLATDVSERFRLEKEIERLQEERQQTQVEIRELQGLVRPKFPQSDETARGADSEKSISSSRRSDLIYAIGGLSLGLVCVIGGIVLFLMGISASTDWTATILGLKTELTDAAPGAILFVVGLVFVLITRLKDKADPE